MLVFHVSDIHIRSGGRERCRADEYEAVIRGLVDACAEAFESGAVTDADDASDADAGRDRRDMLVVVTGDVFHDKGSVGKAGIELFFALMRGLARHARVAVIRGNHDFVQERFAPGDPCCDTGDIIDALLSEAPIEGVAYLRSTGLHELPPFGLGVLAVAIAYNGASFTGRYHEGTGIAITVSRSPLLPDMMVRVTVKIPFVTSVSGEIAISVDSNFGDFSDVVGECPDETFVEFFVRKMDPEDYSVYKQGKGHGRSSGFHNLCVFYECLGVPFWHMDMLRERASYCWHLCHDSEEECVEDWTERRRNTMMEIDYDVTIAIEALVEQMTAETLRRSRAASCVQKHWRAMPSSPCTTVICKQKTK